MRGFADLADLPEDERIRIIGNYLVTGQSGGKPVLVAVDNHPGKADRYIRTLTRLFPKITKWQILDGLVPNTLSIKVWPPEPEQ